MKHRCWAKDVMQQNFGDSATRRKICLLVYTQLHYDRTGPSCLCNILCNPFCQKNIDMVNSSDRLNSYSVVYVSWNDKGLNDEPEVIINKKVQFTPTEVITGCLYQTNVLLVNVYAPNWDDTEFVNKLMSLLPNLDKRKLILGGHLNCAINPTLDRLYFKKSSPSGMAKAFITFMEQSGCIDPWRLLNPTLFSFFSPVHPSFSRIDNFFVDSSFIPSFKAVEYSSIIIFDHAPVVIDIYFALNIKQRPLWKLDPRVLSDEDF